MAVTPSFPAPTGVSISSTQSRAALAALVVRDSSGLPRAGVAPRSSSVLVAARASMGVDVAAFEGVVVRNGLPAFIANDGSVTVTLGAAPASNSRIDVVWVKQNETASPFSDANNTPTFGVTAGTAAASPVKPSIPAGALELATVQIPSTATTTQSSGVVITQTFAYTAVTGAPIWVRNVAEQTAITGYSDGVLIYRIDTKMLLQRITAAVNSTAYWQAIGGALPFAEGSIPAASGITGGVWVTLGTTTPSAINDVAWGGASQAGRYIAKTRGRYRITGEAIQGSTGWVQGRIRINGNDNAIFGQTLTPVANSTGYPTASVEMTLNPDDYAEFQIVTSTGGNLVGGRITVTYIGAAP